MEGNQDWVEWLDICEGKWPDKELMVPEKFETRGELMDWLTETWLTKGWLGDIKVWFWREEIKLWHCS